MMDIKGLNKLDFGVAYSKIKKYIEEKGAVEDDELLDVLSLEDNDLIVVFLEGVREFTENQLQFLESFVNQNLLNGNRDFVSDLIFIAKDWSLDLPYKLILSNLQNWAESERDVVLASIYYISENIKLGYIDDIFSQLVNIINDSRYFQNTQIIASICLFRITQDENYLTNIKDWFADSSDNVEFLQNYLRSRFLEAPYFAKDIKKILLMPS